MSTGGATLKGGVQQTPPVITSKKPKSDSKSDKVDLNPKIHATAEQMQIAKIIDTHRVEDPELQKKIRQVMEITRTTEDQASMALHSGDYDIERAITLITEGGSQSLESEWAQVGKKRKTKTPAAASPNQKSDAANAAAAPVSKDAKLVVAAKDVPARDKLEKRDSKPEKKEVEAGDQLFVGDQRRGERAAGRGGGIGNRGRGGPRGTGRGGGRSDKENEEQRSNRLSNGPGRGGRGGGGGSFGGRGGSRGGGGGSGGGRTFASRARGEDDSYNTIDVWENSQAEGTSSGREAPLKVEKWGEFPLAEEWDNDEYKGSLADTKVFTPSTQTPQSHLNDGPNGVTGSGSPNLNHIKSASNTTAADILKMSGNQDSGVAMSSVVQGLVASSSAINGSGVQAGQRVDLNMLLSKQSVAGVSAVTNPGVNLLASLQSSYSNSNQGLPQRNKVQRPRGPTSKIPSSAVEMPDDPNEMTTLDVQFGGMDLSSDPSLSFGSLIQGSKSSMDNSMMYGGQNKLDAYGSAGDKDVKPTTVGHGSSPFQTLPGALNDHGKVGSIPSGIESLNSLTQNQSKPTGNNPYGPTVNSGSAFATFSNKPAPGFPPPAPGFPPVSQNAGGTYSSSNIAPVTGVIPHAYGSQTLPNQQQSGYMANLAYGSQASSIQSQQPILASSQNVPYVSNTGPPNAYHMNSSGYNSTSAQYGGYSQKMGGLNTSVGKESSTDVSASIPVSSVSGQMGQTGSVTAASNTKMSQPPTNTTTNTTSKMNPSMPQQGMVMPYILSQNATTVPFYGVQTPMYGYEDNQMQFVPARFDPNLGYYGGGPSYGVVPGRNDSNPMQGYSTTADVRFQRSSSTESPVPSNLASGNTQQTLYNPPTMPFFYVPNNMVHNSHLPYGPPPQMYQQTIATPTNQSSGPHATPASHQYQNKQMYNTTPYAYDANQGPTADYKSSYGTGQVGPNSSTGGKVSSSVSSGVSQQSTDISSMYGKGPGMGKMNVNYDKYGAGQGVYNNSTGAQLGGPPYGVYIQQPDSNPSRPGAGPGPKGKQYSAQSWGGY